jgi:hypothetical protein
VCQGVLTISMRDFGVCPANRTVEALKLPENEYLTAIGLRFVRHFYPPTRSRILRTGIPG